MMRLRIMAWLAFFVTAVLVTTAASAEAPRMSTDELKVMLGKGDVVVYDVRSGGDWSKSSRMIAGSIRGNPNDMGRWSVDLAKGQKIVLYCA